MTVLERDRVAAAMVALRPDWATNGIDRLKAMRTWLTNNVMDWAFRDVLLGLVLVAADTSSLGPARLLTDGPWRTILRTASGNSSEHPLTVAELGLECDMCGVRRRLHAPHSAAVLCHGPHDWRPPRETPPASPETIRAARAAAFTNHTQEQQ